MVTGTYDKVLICRRHLVSSPDLWKAGILKSDELAVYARNRGIRTFTETIIEGFWQIGLLRADLIRSRKPVQRAGLAFVGLDEDSFHVYLDTRRARLKRKGYDGAIARRRVRTDIQPYFHPFRFYVLFEMDRIFSARLSPAQFFFSTSGYNTVVNAEIKRLNQLTSDQNFVDVLDKWNRIAEAAIVFDPVAYSKIFTHGLTDTKSIMAGRNTTYETFVRATILGSDVEELEKIRMALCQAAEILDDNKILHVLIRLTKWHEQHRVRGALGGSMLLRSMAETIRRGMEDAIGREFKEEDELGFGMWMPGARRLLYGADRVLDAPKTALRQFLVEAGIDYGTKVRCYVEGATEYGALMAAVGSLGGVEIINLKGLFWSSGAKGVAFSESLRNDVKAEIFSFVLLDADNKDYVRVIRKAAVDDIVCGRFFVSSPDFELANFTIEELCLVLVELCERERTASPSVAQLVSKVSGASSGEAFFKQVVSEFPGLERFKKNEKWGEALMNYAIREPNWGEGATRPLIEAATLISWARELKYRVSREKFRVDPGSGDLVIRVPER